MKNITAKIKFGVIALALLAIFTSVPVASATTITTHCGATTTTRINGYLELKGNDSATVWFDWGETTALGHSTTRETFTEDSNFSQPIYGLTPNKTYYYRAMGTSEAGSDQGEIKTFIVKCDTRDNTDGGTKPTVDLRADDTHLAFDESTTLRWTSTNADTCSASGGTNGWSGNRSKSGSFSTGDLTRDITYHITCTNENGSANDSVTITVDEEEDGDRPTVDIYANPASVIYGGSSTVTWTSDNADTCRATGGTNGWSGNRSRSGSFNTGSLTHSITFTIRCENENGSATDSVTISVTSQPVVSNPPTVVLFADQTSVSYNGSTTVRWSTTNATSCFASGGSVGWAGSKSIGPGAFYTGSLTSTKTYVLTCSNSSGSASDSISIGVRSQPIYTPTTPRPAGTSLLLVTTSVDRNQPIVPTLDNTNPCPGDELTYNVTYRNVGTASVRNLILRVDMPFEVDYLFSTPTNPTRSGQTLIFNLGTLRANSEGTVTVRMRVRDNARHGAPLNFPATLSYIDSAGYPQSISANVSASVCPIPESLVEVRSEVEKVGIGASVFGAGFLPENLFGWLLLIILILILILLLRHVFGPSPLRSERTVTTNYGNPPYTNHVGGMPPSNLPGTTTTTIHH